MSHKPDKDLQSEAFLWILLQVDRGLIYVKCNWLLKFARQFYFKVGKSIFSAADKNKLKSIWAKMSLVLNWTFKVKITT